MSDLAKAIIHRLPKGGAEVKFSLSNGAVITGVPRIDGNVLRVDMPTIPNRYTLINPANIVSAELESIEHMPEELEEND